MWASHARAVELHTGRIVTPADFSFEDTRDGMPLDEKALRKEIWASSPERR